MASTDAASDGNRPSTTPDTDASGRYLAFQSEASTLVPGDSNGASDVFRRDAESNTVVRVSVDDGGGQIAGDSIEPSISGDGQLVVFVAPSAGVAKTWGESKAAKDRRMKSGLFGIFMRNMQAGTTQYLGEAMPQGHGSQPQVASSGTAVVWTAPVTDPAFGTLGQVNVFHLPLLRSGGMLLPGLLACVSCEPGGPGGKSLSNGSSQEAVVSGDGRHVAYTTTARNQVPGGASACTGQTTQVVLRDMITLAAQQASPASSRSACGSTGASSPSIDNAGTTVAYATDAPLVTDDLNQLTDVYVYNGDDAPVLRASESELGHEGLGKSTAPSLSGDGAHVAFVSEARNLDPSYPDDNESMDVYIYSMAGSAARRVSRNSRGDQADSDSANPTLNHDGSVVVFDSDASNLAIDPVTGALIDTNGVADVFRVGAAGTPLKSATWWLPAESGWGLFLFDQGSVMASAWFTYAADGKPSWLLGVSTPQADGSYRGELSRYTGVPFNQASGPASETGRAVGSHTLTFSGQDALRFDYTVDGVRQVKQLQAFAYGSSTVACRASATPSRASASNYTDVWWGGTGNGGWGLFVTHVGDALYALWYTYDADHQPLFLTAVTQRQADGSFAGPVYRQQDGTPLLQIDGAPPSGGAFAVGDASFRFSDGETGSFEYAIGSTSAQKPITRLQFGDTAAVCGTGPGTAPAAR